MRVALFVVAKAYATAAGKLIANDIYHVTWCLQAICIEARDILHALVYMEMH